VAIEQGLHAASGLFAETVHGSTFAYGTFNGWAFVPFRRQRGVFALPRRAQARTLAIVQDCGLEFSRATKSDSQRSWRQDMWLLFAFSGPVLWAVSTHIDKYLVERYFKNSDTTVLLVFTALIGVLMLPFIWHYRPDVFALRAADIAVMAVSGMLYMGALLFYLRAIQSEEASVVAPLFQTSILFTFLFAYLALGETLTLSEVLGGVLILAGVLLLSLDRSLRFRGFKLRLVLLMLGCTSVLALSTVIFKLFAVKDEFWSTTFWTYAGEAAFGLGIVAVPSYRRQFLTLFKRSPGPVLAINGANELINLGGGLGVRFASLLAPVTLVSAISSTTTLFVFGFGILLTLFFPKLGREDLSPRLLLQKGIAAGLIAAGVALLNFNRPD
jgi:drug/metabolite transporter (DMT)-like permease